MRKLKAELTCLGVTAPVRRAKTEGDQMTISGFNPLGDQIL
jgi:hypothetical protein